jgi:cation:H+ antiporter
MPRPATAGLSADASPGDRRAQFRVVPGREPRVVPTGLRFPPQLAAAVLVGLPGTYFGAAEYLGWPHPSMPPPLAAVLYGVAIVGAAFVLSWAAEAAQVDLSAGVALALLALVAVLPEYAVDAVFSLQAGNVYAGHGGRCVAGPGGGNPCALALANVTGANRVLVGIGWPLVIAVASIAVSRAHRQGEPDSASAHPDGVQLPRAMSTEVVFLGLATVYSLFIPLRHTLTLIDSLVLVAIFAGYSWRLAKAPSEEPQLAGASKWLGELARRRRRLAVGALFLVAGVVILASAEHFADNLVATGTELGLDQFVLVEWVAPLASEAPELIVATLYALRLMAGDSLGALVSSKVNQWTLLVGTIPVIFALSAGTFDGLPLDTQQRFALAVTAAQSLFAVSLLLTLRVTRGGAVALFALFCAQFFGSILLPPPLSHRTDLVLSAVYVALAAVQFLRHRDTIARTARDGVATDFAGLERADAEASGQR